MLEFRLMDFFDGSLSAAVAGASSPAAAWRAFLIFADDVDELSGRGILEIRLLVELFLFCVSRIVNESVRFAADFDNLLVVSKVSFCHWISQKPTFDASFDSSPMLISSSFGDSAPQSKPGAGCPGGQADCHRSANVDMAGGRTGLFSKMRSNSSITLDDKRGSSWNSEQRFANQYHLSIAVFESKNTCNACRLWCSCSAVVAPSNKHCTGSCFSDHAIDNCVALQPNFSAMVHRSRSRSHCLRLSSIFSFDQLKFCRIAKQTYYGLSVVLENLLYKMYTYIFIDFVLVPWITLTLRLEWGLRKEQSITILRIAQRHRQWAPCHEANANLIVHLRQIKLTFLPAEHMVFGLFNNGRNTIELTAIWVRFHNLKVISREYQWHLDVGRNEWFLLRLETNAMCPSTWTSPVKWHMS